MSCEVAIGVDAVHVSGEMTIYAAAQLKEELPAAVRTSQSRQIDLSGVSELDTTGLQLLLMIRRDAAAASQAVSLINASTAVLDCMKLLRMEEELLAIAPPTDLETLGGAET